MSLVEVVIIWVRLIVRIESKDVLEDNSNITNFVNCRKYDATEER
jgi:hypothetical protein